MEIFFDKQLKPDLSREVWGVEGFYTTMCLELDTIGNPHPYFWYHHWERLKNTASRVGMSIPEEDWVLLQVKKLGWEFLEKYPQLTSCLVRFATTVEGFSFYAFYSKPAQDSLVGVLSSVSRMDPEWKLLRDLEFYKVLCSLDRQREELLLLNQEGRILEGATTNLIFKRGNVVFLSEKQNLRGITRKLLEPSLIKWADKVEDQSIFLDQLSSIDEIVCLGSGKEVIGLKSIAEFDWKCGEERLCRYLKKQYSEIKKSDLKGKSVEKRD